MRFVIYGPGAVGGTIAARLSLAGHEVLLIARGDHGATLRSEGMRFVAPEGEHRLRLDTVMHPAEVTWREDDMVLLAMKSQHTHAAVAALAECAPAQTSVICAQNSVANERVALRCFANVYGMLINLPAMHMMPGEVFSFGEGASGLLDAGRFPRGVDERVERLTQALAGSGFVADPDPNIMRKKYAKLLLNLANALEAATDTYADTEDLVAQLHAEARACFDAAGIDCGEPIEAQGGGREIYTFATLPGQERFGGSTWQSLSRGTGNIETDYLNGEVVQLGRLCGVPTPVNELCQHLVRRMLHEGLPVGSFSVDDVRDQVRALAKR